MSDICAIYSTFDNRQTASQVAAHMVLAKLVACANIIKGVTSVYQEGDELAMVDEVVMICKTSAATVDSAVMKLEELHPYDTPCITVLPISGGNQSYRQWVCSQTGSA